MTMLAYLLLGLALGAGSSVLPGPCGLAVMTAACRRSLGRAIAIGAGAALGDLTYAALGIVGLGPVLARHPAIPPVLQAISGVALIAYGLMNLRGRPAATRRPAVGGLLTGVGLLLANPGAFVTWVVVVGTALAGASPVEGWCAVVGICAGSCAWFSGVAWLTHRGHQRRGDGVLRVITVVSVLLVAGGALSLARAAQGFLA
jgi:threonine/homoserine/homoserine lactone efflux protein